MRKLYLLLSIIPVSVIYSQDLPEHSTSLYVTDLANVLTDQQELSLDKRIREYKAATTTEFAVGTVPTLQGYDVADFANKLFKKWQIGTKEQNNGLLFLMCPAERKWRIEVGYGLEPFLTDYYTKQMGTEILKPNFKKQMYFEGIDALLANFMQKLGNANFAVMKDTYNKTQAELAREAEIAAERQKAEDEAAHERFMSVLFWVFIVLGFAGLIGVLVYMDVQKKKRIRLEKEEAERKEAERKRRVHELKDQILKLKKYAEERNPRVRTIEDFKYDIGQKSLRAIFEQDCKEIAAEVVELSDFEFELQQTHARLNNIVKESEHAIKEFEIVMKHAMDMELKVNSIQDSIRVLKYKTQDSQVVYDYVTRTYKSQSYKGMLNPHEVPGKIQDIEARYTNLRNLLGSAVCGLGNSNFMQVSSEVSRQIEAINRTITVTSEILQSPYTHRESINKAESTVKRANTDVQSLISKAKNVSRNSDVGSTAKRKMNDAIEKSNGMQLTGEPISDAIVVGAVVVALTSAISAMERDISDAERERERERERIRRKKREERRRRNSYSSSSSSDWGSSSGGSSFGGGDSGGGGSSGDW